MSGLPVRVIKVGGSLLSWPELSAALARWLAAQSPARQVIIAGGGALVRELRAWQPLHALDDAAVHWLAIQSLGTTAQLLRNLLTPAPEYVDDWGVLTARCAQTTQPGTCVLNAKSFLREIDARGAAPLPCDWRVTSDSIAARVAACLAAAELVLLKSTLPPPGTAPTEWSRTEYVDGYFPAAAAELLRVRCVNLRAAMFPEIAWLSSGPQPGPRA